MRRYSWSRASQRRAVGLVISSTTSVERDSDGIQRQVARVGVRGPLPMLAYDAVASLYYITFSAKLND